MNPMDPSFPLSLSLPHGNLSFPVYLPDATYGMVRAADATDLLAARIGMKPGNLQLQYEGLNPSGSFKDNGMTAAFTHARMVGATKVACASTGNTSASLAMYAWFLLVAVYFIRRRTEAVLKEYGI